MLSGQTRVDLRRQNARTSAARAALQLAICAGSNRKGQASLLVGVVIRKRTSIRGAQARLTRGGVKTLAAMLLLGACAQQRQAEPAPVVQPAPARAWSAISLAELRSVAEAMPSHGLPAETRQIAEVDRLDAAAHHDAVAAAALDGEADALFIRFAQTFAQGATDPQSADPDWAIARAPSIDAAQMLAVARTLGGVAAMLDAQLPATPEYQQLEAELQRVTSEPQGATDASGLTREARLDHLRASLERWRWLARTMPVRRIDVLVPFFEARLVGFGPLGNHRVIVGVPRMPTPIFAAEIQSITLNPSWTPPNSIVLAELLPRFRRDPASAAAEDFEALDASGRVVDPALIDWRARPFPYVLRQRPGARNALGQVRFDMPNDFAIYLHDTPARNLFECADRTLSHGCIRVDDPVGLAADVLADPQWSRGALQAQIDEGATQIVRLEAPLPIYVLYLTAAMGADGAVRYADDVYGRNRALLQRLERSSVRTLAASDVGPVRCAG